ncbi:hypothetical protein BC833DRAFT_573667 [Globomyces pollinis-pini]|nr:hypothetical protein BC833DRAFT_573667 [Globomyces pollinis-pini]
MSITVDDVKLYDRQIRLWGMEAQERMQRSKILIVGVTGLTNETLKNIVLAGVGHITVLDDAVVREVDLGCQFLLRKSDIGKNIAESILPRLKMLNPRVDIHSDKESVSKKSVEYFQKFDIVCMINSTPNLLLKVNDICHKNGILFWCSSTMGMQSYIFSDLHKHTFTQEVKKTGSLGMSVEKVERTIEYYPLKGVLEMKFGMPLLQGRSGRKWSKSANPLFFALNIIWSFWLIHNRYPNVEKDRADLNRHRLEYLKKAEVDPIFVTEEYVLSLTKRQGIELSPVCAIVGGFLGQEILKVLARKEVPFNNFFCHDAHQATAQLMKISPTA